MPASRELQRFVDQTTQALAGLPKCPIEPIEGIECYYPMLGWLFEHNASLVKAEGTWVEFGVASQRSYNYIAKHRGTAKLWGVDSFRGLPENWVAGAPQGSFAVGHVPLPAEGTNYLVGLFSDVLPAFSPPEPVTFCHVDCDLYSSTKTVLEWLKLHVIPGSIIVFDDILWKPLTDHGLKALHEAWPDVSYEWLCSGNPQAVLRVTSIPNANGEGGQ